MFVRLDDGPRPFDDLLQAQRAGMVQQQQGFENALAAEQHKVRRDQGAESLRIAEGRNNILRRDTAGRTVSRAMKAAESFGRPMTPSRQSFEQMAAVVAKSNPEAMQPFMDLEFEDEMLSTPEGAAAYEAMSGLWLAEEGKRSGEAANRALLGSQALMADPRAGLTDKDLEPMMKLLDEGTAPAEQIEAQFQAIKGKAAKNIGFAEMKLGVMGEVTQAWGPAMAQINAGASKSMAGLGEKSDAELLATLRGEIETATTPDELHKARGQFLVKAYGLDGVISEAETAAFEAGRTAADAMYRQAFGGAMGGQRQPAQGGAAAPQAPAQGGAQMNAERFPNLAAAANRAVGGADPLSERQKAALSKRGFTAAPQPGTEDAAEASTVLDEEEKRYAKDMAGALESVANGSSPAKEAKARNVDLGPLEEVASQKASDVRMRRRIEEAWDKAKKALGALGSSATDAAKRSAVVKAGAAKSREDAARVVAAVAEPLTPEEDAKLKRFVNWSANDADLAEWTGIPFQRIREWMPQLRAAAGAEQTRQKGEKAIVQRESARQSRVAAGFKDRDALIAAVAQQMVDMDDGAGETVTALFEEKYGFTLAKNEIVEARRKRAQMVRKTNENAAGPYNNLPTLK